MSHGFGWEPDSPDERDLLFALPKGVSASEPPPYEASAAEYMTPKPLDQNGKNSCPVEVAVQLLHAAHVRAGHASPPLASRDHLWYPCRRFKRAQSENVGTQNRIVFKVMNALGFCQDKYFPYSYDMGPDAPWRHQPPTNAQRMAHDQRNRGKVVYRRIDATGDAFRDQLKRCIVAGMPVQIGTSVGKTLVRDQHDPLVPIGPPSGSDFAGMHALAVCAYQGDDFRLRTSWGDHSDNGYFWVNKAYTDIFQDAWYIESAPWYSELA